MLLCVWQLPTCSRGQSRKKREDGWRWRGEPERKREIEVRGRWAHEESWEKELLLTRLSSGDTILSPFSWLAPLWRLGRFFAVCQPNPPPASSSTRPPSLESVIRPSWWGVKNIMREGPPSKKEPGGTFSTHAVPSLTLSSALRPLQTSISPLPPLLCSSKA